MRLYRNWFTLKEETIFPLLMSNKFSSPANWPVMARLPAKSRALIYFLSIYLYLWEVALLRSYRERCFLPPPTTISPLVLIYLLWLQFEEELRRAQNWVFYHKLKLLAIRRSLPVITWTSESSIKIVILACCYCWWRECFPPWQCHTHLIRTWWLSFRRCSYRE